MLQKLITGSATLGLIGIGMACSENCSAMVNAIGAVLAFGFPLACVLDLFRDKSGVVVEPDPLHRCY